ncbi:HPr family phosphocarrier protein [Cytobacillus horneckiae]|nr:HPr family phosphocarrier protein [Cytobacillus horneckiae]MCM3178739.1 HPr family phosphocarrier protein [Cytobacillus horneckiae]
MNMNKKIISANVIINKRFSMKKMMDIYLSAKNFNGTVYLLNNHKIVDISSLSKIVSFLLMVQPHTKLKIIVEGIEVQNQLDKVKEICTEEIGDLIISKERQVHLYQTIQL